MKKKRWPIVSAVAMNIYDHKFGGSGKKGPGMSKCTAKNGSPGTKVGSIGASRTGINNKKK